MMTVDKLRAGREYWCWWKSRYLWYIGKAYNGKDYEFEDAGDCIIVLNKEEVANLEIR